MIANGRIENDKTKFKTKVYEELQDW